MVEKKIEFTPFLWGKFHPALPLVALLFRVCKQKDIPDLCEVTKGSDTSLRLGGKKPSANCLVQSSCLSIGGESPTRLASAKTLNWRSNRSFFGGILNMLHWSPGCNQTI